ncbi:MAG: hypothetical protein P8X74_03465 [Reinekea sp.]
MLPKNWGEPMGAPAIFEKQIEIKLLHSASTEGVTDSGGCDLDDRPKKAGSKTCFLIGRNISG